MERIEELEEALRESVKITAQREMVMAEQQLKIEDTEKQVSRAGEPNAAFWYYSHITTPSLAS